MANASPTMKQRDCNLPVAYSPRDTDPEHQVTRNGSAKTLASRANSSVALFAANHVNNAWTKNEADKDYSNSDAKPKESADPTLGQILDLLKEQRSHSKKKTGSDDHDHETDIAMTEWQMVAMVADRVMLIVFTLVALIVTTALFGGAPT